MMGLVTAYNLPSLFITLNPADIVNPLVSFWHNAGGTEAFNLDTLLPEIPDTDARKQIVADDPVHCSEMFDTVVNTFMESFLGFELREVDGLTGKLINESIFTGNAKYSGLPANFGTVECQGRGALHIHLLVWLCGLPNSSEIIRRISEALKNVEALRKSTAPPDGPTMSDDGADRSPDYESAGAEVPATDDDDFGMSTLTRMAIKSMAWLKTT
jgi:hypothetical protein